MKWIAQVACIVAIIMFVVGCATPDPKPGGIIMTIPGKPPQVLYPGGSEVMRSNLTADVT